jgi:hypothetical protein
MRRSSPTVLLDETAAFDIEMIGTVGFFVRTGSPGVTVDAPGNFHRTFEWHPERPDAYRLFATEGTF